MNFICRSVIFNLLSHGGENLRMIEFINDGLMTIFFLLVGLEIKRELLVGELSSFRKAALPFIAACGGMLFPVIVYMSICPPAVRKSGIGHSNGNGYCFFVRGIKSVGKPCAV